MYLQDFQKIGGIFVPGKVLHSSLNQVSMRGELHLQGEIFYIKILARKRHYIKITQICGQTSDEAVSGKRRLKKIYAEAFQNNKCELKTFVRTRQNRTLLWFIFTLIDFFCIILSIVNICKYGATTALLMACVISILLFVICLKCKMPIIRGL